MTDPNKHYQITQPKYRLPEGWVTLLHNGEPWMHGPPTAMEKLATDPEARKESRRSKKHHDRKPV